MGGWPYLSSSAPESLFRAWGSRVAGALMRLAEPGVRHPLLTSVQHVNLTADEGVARGGLGICWYHTGVSTTSEMMAAFRELR